MSELGSNNVDQISKRKDDHIRFCLMKDVTSKRTTGFEDINLIHRALPEMDQSGIDISTDFLGHSFRAPLIITGITGGSEEAFRINARIAEAVEELGIGMGVGSQRAALGNKRIRHTYSVVREKAPEAFLVANVGAPQLKKKSDIKNLKIAINMIKADALAIHLNPLQEVIQPEGEPLYSGVIENIGEVADKMDLPLIVKETGAGISSEDAIKLEDAGVSCIDIAGHGGTSWAAVEYYRAMKAKDHLRSEIGKTFWDWGIPTAVSLVETAQSVKIPVIASGGLRSGIDIAKALSLGASLSGLALPVLKQSIRSSKDVKECIDIMLYQLKTAMFLVGAKTTRSLNSVPVVVIGKTAEWLRLRGFDLEYYATRGGGNTL